MTRSSRAACAALVSLIVGTGTPSRGASVPVPGTSATVDASGYIDGLAVVDVHGPRQRPQAIGELSLASRITRALRTQLTLRGRIGGPFEGGHPGVMNFVHEFQNRTPSLEFNEAYAELRLGDAQVRAGIQKFAWGKLDGQPPTDVLTPRDLHDPIVRDYEESKIGIPAVQLAYYLPPVPSIDLHDLKVNLVYVPIAVPSRVALADERWFPPSIRTGDVDVRESTAQGLIDAQCPPSKPECRVLTVKGDQHFPVSFNTLDSRPPLELDAGGIALRIGGTIHEMDWSISHYTGPETGPDAELLASANCVNCLGTVVNEHKLPIRAHAILRQDHDIIHMTGADWSTALGGATVRAEVAVFQNRPYLRISNDVVQELLRQLTDSRNPDSKRRVRRVFDGKGARLPLNELFPDRDSVEWGVGADYMIAGFLPLLQLNQVIFTDDGPEELLSNPETRFVASVRKRFLQDTLEVEARGVYAIERGSWFVHPRVTYRAGDHWRLRLGYLAIGGPAESVIGQFRDNDELTLEARYGF